MTTHCSGILCFSVHQRDRAFGGGDGCKQRDNEALSVFLKIEKKK